MSYTDSITFMPGGSHAALVGQRIAVRLGMDYDYGAHGAAYQDKPRFDNVVLEAVNPLRPSPEDGSITDGGDVTLSWTNLAPNTGSDVWVDVWFGTDPGSLAQVVDATGPEPDLCHGQRPRGRHLLLAGRFLPRRRSRPAPRSPGPSSPSW